MSKLLKCSLVFLIVFLMAGCSGMRPDIKPDMEARISKSGLDIDLDGNDAVDVVYGGTNATTAADARTSLGLGTAAVAATGDFEAAGAVTAHAGAVDPHTGYMLESNIGTGANNYPKLGATPGTPDGTKFYRDDNTWAVPSGEVLSTAALWDAAGDLVQGTGANTAAKLTKGAQGTILQAGASTNAWSAYTLPATVPTVGKVLISDGTNLIGSTALGTAAYAATTAFEAADADIPTVAASQEEMEAGTEAAVRSMSPLRVAQAIAALAGEGTDTIGWAYTALTEAPTGGALITGKIYRANNEAGGWDPITYAGTDDYFVLWTGSAWVGLIDINGNWLLSSTSILTAAAPTIDAAGEVAVDTTSDQLAYYGGAKRVIPYKQYVSAVIPAPADTDDINLLKAPYGMTILAINCIVQGTTSVTGQLQECDSAGANCADLDSDITCDADGADDGTLTDSAIASGAWLRWKTTSVSGTPTFLTVTVTYSVVSD